MSSNDNGPVVPVLNETRDTRIKPRLRDEAVQAFLRVLAILDEQSKESFAMTRSCITCAHFKETAEHDGRLIDVEQCTLHGERPPARVIAYSCVDYRDQMDIPF
jgi:hypothetical protein